MKAPKIPYERLEALYAELASQYCKLRDSKDSEWLGRFLVLEHDYKSLEEEFRIYKENGTKRWQDSIVIKQALRDLTRSMEVLKDV